MVNGLAKSAIACTMAYGPRMLMQTSSEEERLLPSDGERLPEDSAANTALEVQSPPVRALMSLHGRMSRGFGIVTLGVRPMRPVAFSESTVQLAR